MKVNNLKEMTIKCPWFKFRFLLFSFTFSSGYSLSDFPQNYLDYRYANHSINLIGMKKDFAFIIV